MLEPEIYELVIVFVGDFNPSIISPSWLAYKNLIQENENKRSKVHVIHNELSKFELDWCELEITRNRFLLRTIDQSKFEPALDLVASVFQLLNETPISSLGINHIFHYRLKSDQYLNIGKKLAPFENWKEVLDEPRLLLIEMKEEPRKDEFHGLYRIKLNPSERIDKYGISLNINDHYQLDPLTGSDPERRRAEEFVSLLISAWKHSKEKAFSVTDNLWKNLGL